MGELQTVIVVSLRFFYLIRRCGILFIAAPLFLCSIEGHSDVIDEMDELAEKVTKLCRAVRTLEEQLKNLEVLEVRIESRLERSEVIVSTTSFESELLIKSLRILTGEALPASGVNWFSSQSVSTVIDLTAHLSRETIAFDNVSEALEYQSNLTATVTDIQEQFDRLKSNQIEAVVGVIRKRFDTFQEAINALPSDEQGPAFARWQQLGLESLGCFSRYLY